MHFEYAENLYLKCKNTLASEIEAFKKKLSPLQESNGLQVGDTIQFYAGYDSDILVQTVIFGFDNEGLAYVWWDCYWLGINLNEPRRKVVRKIKVISINE
jgi:hypothetical protein